MPGGNQRLQERNLGLFVGNNYLRYRVYYTMKIHSSRYRLQLYAIQTIIRYKVLFRNTYYFTLYNNFIF